MFLTESYPIHSTSGIIAVEFILRNILEKWSSPHKATGIIKLLIDEIIDLPTKANVAIYSKKAVFLRSFDKQTRVNFSKIASITSRCYYT